MGGSALSSAHALDILESLITSDVSNVGVMELDWRALSRFLPSAQQPKFRLLARRHGQDGNDDGQSDDVAQWVATLSDAELHTRFVELLRLEVGDILRVAPEKIDPDQSVYDMGLDSLMGVELVVALEGRFGVRLPVMALNDSPTLSKLAIRLAHMLKDGGQPDTDDPSGTRTQIAHVAAQHATALTPETLNELTEQLSGASTQPNRMIH